MSILKSVWSIWNPGDNMVYKYSKTETRAYNLKRRFVEYSARRRMSNRWTIACFGKVPA